MAADHNKRPPRVFFTFVLFFHLATVSVCSSQCTDGTYDHDGRKCCLCGVGWYLKEHCTENLKEATCEPCQNGTYNSVPNSLNSCERCTSCLQPNDNLEEDELCTPARDRKCRCKKDHYCVSYISGVCRLCQPCTRCGEDGVKVPCTGNSNTVCNEKIEGGNDPGKTAAIIVAVLLLIIVLAGVGVFIWKKRRPKRVPNPTKEDPPEEGNWLLEDMERHLNDIAEAIGWKDMQHVAMRSGVSAVKIDSCKMNYPNDVQEQTFQLLRIWVESQGGKAAQNLFQMLRDLNKRGTAEKVRDILSRDSQNPPV